MSSRFIKSASRVEESPESSLPEVAFVGHSNAGKSTLINVLAGNRNLARVSQNPGKTDLINFYEIDKTFMLVDLPGYGYAARGRTARKGWGPMIEGYLSQRENLKGVVLVFDAARNWSEDEQNLVDWLHSNGLPIVVAASKVDKFNQKELAKVKRELGVQNQGLTTVYISSPKKVGIDELLRTVFDKLIRS